MRKILFLFALALSGSIFAQSPEQMSFQAVVRTSEDILVSSAPVGIRISILQGSATGTPVFIETHQPTTNANGLVSLSIGAGTYVSGNFSSIDWAAGPYFLKVETDPTGGSTYSITNTSQMLSVPYALYSKTAGSSSTGWNLNGNNTTGSDFIGTNNLQPLKFKVNGVRSGYIGPSYFNDFNVFLGSESGISNTLGDYNVANGYQSLSSNTEGNYNVANGSQSLYRNTIGSENVANGYLSLSSNTEGGYNVANGSQSLYRNTIGSRNVANGAYSLGLNTNGNNNVANGYYSLYSNTSGGDNVANGNQSLFSNISGGGNVANGAYTLYLNTIGSGNVANGSQSLYSNTTGNYNVANGSGSLYSNTEGYNNIANGTQSLYLNTTGFENVANGKYSLYFNTTGYWNVANGASSLYSNTTGCLNTAIGYNSNVTSGNLNNATAIGFNAKVNASNKVRIGNTDVTVIEGQVPFSNPSDARFKYNISDNVPGLDFINKLQPVTYYLDENKLEEFTKTGVINNTTIYPVSYKGEKELHTGFLAQDVEKIALELGYHFDGVRVPENDKGYYSLAYSQFIMPLVKSVQEQQELIEKQSAVLSTQQTTIEQLQETNKQLQDAIKNLEIKVEKLIAE